MCPVESQSRLVNVESDCCHSQLLKMQREQRDRPQLARGPKQVEGALARIVRNSARELFEFVRNSFPGRNHNDKLLSRAPVQAPGKKPCGLTIGILVRQDRPTEFDHYNFSCRTAIQWFFPLLQWLILSG